MYKVSVIIPVYNAEDCLENAINSIINQSIGFDNIELLLIDDNSSDNSRDIILKYSKNYDNVKYFFSDKNHGFPGFGRDLGVKMASSDYVMFLDNDDEFDFEMCERLYDAVVNYDCDIACCDIKEIDDISVQIHKLCPDNGEEFILFNKEELLKYDINWVWNKIFKKQIIYEYNIHFLTDTYCDDKAFSIEFLLHSEKMVYLNGYAGYLWMRRNESLSNSIELNKLLSIFKGYDYMIDVLIKNNRQDLFSIIGGAGTLFLLIQASLLKSNGDKKDFLKLLFEFEKKCDFNIHLDNLFFSTLNKFVVKKRFNFAVLMLNIYRKLKSFSFVRRAYRILGD